LTPRQTSVRLRTEQQLPAVVTAKPHISMVKLAHTSIEQRLLPRCIEPSYVRRRTEM